MLVYGKMNRKKFIARSHASFFPLVVCIELEVESHNFHDVLHKKKKTPSILVKRLGKITNSCSAAILGT